MKSLDHKEWKDALSDDNIPSTIQDRCYHLLLGQASNIKQSHTAIEIMQPVSIKLYVKGYRDTNEGRDKAVTYQDAVIKRALVESRRNGSSYPGVKNVIFVDSAIEQMSSDNDNVFRVTMNFSCYLTMASA